MHLMVLFRKRKLDLWPLVAEDLSS
jgi:hypothetical protein